MTIYLLFKLLQIFTSSKKFCVFFFILPKDVFGQSSSVSRRLQFDGEEGINMDVDSYMQNSYSLVTGIQENVTAHQQQCSNVSEIDKALEIQTTIAAYSLQNDDNCFRTVVESLSARGFVVVNNHLQPDNRVGREDENSCRTTTAEAVQCQGKQVENDDAVSSICGQFECLSVLEGVVYDVQAASKKDASRIRTASVLATVGPHPNIVSYFSNWTDARFHYVQMEFCPENLSSVSDRLTHTSDFRIVLEHVACALYYLHSVKKYAHNRVNRWNIYQKLEDDGVHAVYKLGGFHSASKLQQPSDDEAAFSDVRSLCFTVLRLMKYRYGSELVDDKDARELLSYLSSVVKGRAEPSANDIGEVFWATNGRLDAQNVWQWCCSARERRQYLMDVDMVSV